MLELLKFLGGFYPQEDSYFPFQKEQNQFFGFTPFDTHTCFYMDCGIQEQLRNGIKLYFLDDINHYWLYYSFVF